MTTGVTVVATSLTSKALRCVAWRGVAWRGVALLCEIFALLVGEGQDPFPPLPRAPSAAD